MKDGRLEFSDWPMFDHVMMREDLCRELLEVVLERPISKIEYIVAEQEIHPTFLNHGVRLDAFVKAQGEVYDVEMQTLKRGQLGRRLRYYQGAIDALTLQRGAGYDSLPLCFVVFICMHDPLNRGLPVYTLDMNCREDQEVQIGHGFKWIVLSAPAWEKLPAGRLRNLLHYAVTGEAGSDSFIQRLDAVVSEANDDELWRREKMGLLTLEKDLEIQKRIAQKEARERGMAQGLAEGLAEGRAKGLAEGRAAGIAEGRAEGLAEGRAEGIAEGRAEGHAEGRAEGIVEGRAEGEAVFARLVEALVSEGRMEEVARAASDADARNALFEEFGIAR